MTSFVPPTDSDSIDAAERQNQDVPRRAWERDKAEFYLILLKWDTVVESIKPRFVPSEAPTYPPPAEVQEDVGNSVTFHVSRTWQRRMTGKSMILVPMLRVGTFFVRSAAKVIGEKE